MKINIPIVNRALHGNILSKYDICAWVHRKVQQVSNPVKETALSNDGTVHQKEGCLRVLGFLSHTNHDRSARDLELDGQQIKCCMCFIKLGLPRS